MTIHDFNRLSFEAAKTELERCCGSHRWAERLASERPFANRSDLHTAAEKHWLALEEADWKEAFSHHPRIGAKALREKFASTAAWALEEQRGAASASDEVIEALAEGNIEYEKRFGHVFLICATGKSAVEMLEQLRARIGRSAQEELQTAAAEQSKITRIRLDKLITE